MPIGAQVPGSLTTVTPDTSPSYYTSVQGPAPDGLVVADDVLAVQLIALNIQKVIKTILDGFFPNGTTATFAGREVTIDEIVSAVQFTSQATFLAGVQLGNGSGDAIGLGGTLTPSTGGLVSDKVVQTTLTGDLSISRFDQDVTIVTDLLGSNRNVDFSATSMVTGIRKTIKHEGSANVLTLRNPGPLTICTLNPGEFATVSWSNPGYFHRIG